jgi:hypothetical protein
MSPEEKAEQLLGRKPTPKDEPFDSIAGWESEKDEPKAKPKDEPVEEDEPKDEAAEDEAE